MSEIVFDAWTEHLKDQWFREWTAEQDAAEAAAWEPVRQQLARIRKAPTWDEVREMRRLPEAREVIAAPGWPPIAIPGRPGWWRHCINGQQVDRPTRQPHQKGAA